MALQNLPILDLPQEVSPFVPVLCSYLIPSSCNASLCTTSAHLVLGLPTGFVLWKVPFKTLFGILSSSILIIADQIHLLHFWNSKVHYRVPIRPPFSLLRVSSVNSTKSQLTSHSVLYQSTARSIISGIVYQDSQSKLFKHFSSLPRGVHDSPK
jgi:hypothetical protein